MHKNLNNKISVGGGINFFYLKIFFVLVFLFISSPVFASTVSDFSAGISGNDLNGFSNSGTTWSGSSNAFKFLATNPVKLGESTVAGGVVLSNFTPLSANYTLSASVYVATQSGSISLITRAVNNNNYYLGVFNYSNGTVYIYKAVGGSFALLATQTFAPGSIGANEILSFGFNGSTLSLLINGATILSVSDSTYSNAGFIGLRAGATGAPTTTTGLHINNIYINDFYLAGPSVSLVNNPSSNFTVTPTQNYTGTITITPTGPGATGLTPVVLTFSNSSIPQTFTITPTSLGNIILTPTNSGSMVNPSSISSTSLDVYPNSIAGLQLWLKADTGVTSSGGNVSAWADQSGQGNNATAGGVPTLLNNQLNINPVVRLGGAPAKISFPIISAQTIFVVYKDNGTNQSYADILGLDSGSPFSGATVLSGKLIDPTYSSLYVRNGSANVDGSNIAPIDIPVSTNFHVYSFVTTNTVTFQNLGNNQAQPDRYRRGDYAEVIAYSNVISPSERASIERYLGIKYGININNIFTAGNISLSSYSPSSLSLVGTNSTGGSYTYTYQWHRSLSTGFTPSVANILSGANSLNLNDTGLTAGQTYYYKLVYSDGENTPVVSNEISGIPSTPPFILYVYADGDSVTSYGGNYTGFYEADIETALPHVTANVVNVSVSGQSQAQMLSDLQTQILVHDPDIITLSTYLNDMGTDPFVLTANIRSYIDQSLAHINTKTNLPPQLILMTDNLSGQNLSESWARPIALQLSTAATVLAAYNLYSDNPNVYIVDNFASFYALGVDSSGLYSVLLADKVHPNAAGYNIFHNNMQSALLSASSRINIATTNSAPVAQSVSVSGSLEVGNFLTGSYVYSDVDGDLVGSSRYRWLRNDLVITGAVSNTYTTVSADIGTTVKFEVTPVSLSGTTPGTAVVSTGLVILGSTSPIATISYDITTLTIGSVVATITPSESITVTNNEGSLSHTFTSNGTFTFEFVDTAGNTGTAIATVSNIITPSEGTTKTYGSTSIAIKNTLFQQSTTSQPSTLAFTKTLKQKSTNTEVKELQKYLNSKGFTISTTGAGSVGHETNYFGLKTKQALIKFQKANGLVPDGILGPKTRAMMK